MESGEKECPISTSTGPWRFFSEGGGLQTCSEAGAQGFLTPRVPGFQLFGWGRYFDLCVKWGCVPLTHHLGGDFDHGKLMGPVWVWTTLSGKQQVWTVFWGRELESLTIGICRFFSHRNMFHPQVFGFSQRVPTQVTRG